MDDRITSFYLHEQIQLGSLLFPSEHATQKGSDEFIRNHTLSIQDKRRTSQFPRVNLCFDVIIRTKLLHHGRLFRENQYLFLFFEELHEFRKCRRLHILHTHRRMHEIANLINLCRSMLTTNPLKIRCEIESESEGLWLFLWHKSSPRWYCNERINQDE